MASFNYSFTVDTKGENTSINLTSAISDAVAESGISDGIVHVFVQSTTSSVFICEDEQGLLKDIIDAARRIAPENVQYKHNLAWHDDNGRSHVKASIIGQSITVPLRDSRLQLGTWQSIFLFEFDVRPRERNIVVSIIH